MRADGLAQVSASYCAQYRFRDSCNVPHAATTTSHGRRQSRGRIDASRRRRSKGTRRSTRHVSHGRILSSRDTPAELYNRSLRDSASGILSENSQIRGKYRGLVSRAGNLRSRRRTRLYFRAARICSREPLFSPTTIRGGEAIVRVRANGQLLYIQLR